MQEKQSHHHHHHHRKKKLKFEIRSLFCIKRKNDRERNKKDDILRAIIYCVMIGLVLIIVCRGLDRWKAARDTKVINAILATSSENVQEMVEETFVFDGEIYDKKKQLETYLFMGIDVEHIASESEAHQKAGQADVQMLLVIDNEQETWRLLQLNRDSMVEVSILGTFGTLIGYETEQLALAYAYGDGRRSSCENNAKVVSKLLGNQHIDGYFSMTLEGLAKMNDTIGGVPVTITSDFSKVDDSLPLGEMVILTGEQALTFVRSRQGVDDQSNLSRMARQRQYLASLTMQLMQQNENTILKIYDEIQEDSVTNVGSKIVLNLFQKMQLYSQEDLMIIEGSAKIENGHIAYYLEEESLQETIKTLFYTKK